MNRKILISLVVTVIVGFAVFYFYQKVFPSKPERKILYWTDSMIPGDRSDHPGTSPMGMERTPVYADEVQAESPPQKSYYTCPMHPSVHKDGPGACPICGMTLVKKTDGVVISDNEQHSLQTVTISPSRQVLANVSTSVARRMALQKEIRAVGKIDYAESNYRNISARFPGRLEKLYLTYTGQHVRKGDPVADVYSPEAISAQKEYLLAKDSYDQVKDANEIFSSSAFSLLEQSKQKLLLWGFTQEQLQQLGESKQVNNNLTIYSPISGTVLKKNVDPQHYAAAGENMYDVADLSTVWIYVDVYEYEMNGIKIGQHVEVTSDSYPDETFSGTVNFISPTVDPSGRTVKVRAELPNLNEKLKPEMFVTATLKITLPPSIVVPTNAVLSTGTKQIVWIRQREGVFEPRFVKVGERSEDNIQILNGINVGDTVVTSGGYLIDSESQLQATQTH
jgi:Cu(I)/Ag(I) efflux system membrane fusion protein